MNLHHHLLKYLHFILPHLILIQAILILALLPLYFLALSQSKNPSVQRVFLPLKFLLSITSWDKWCVQSILSPTLTINSSMVLHSTKNLCHANWLDHAKFACRSHLMPISWKNLISQQKLLVLLPSYYTRNNCIHHILRTGS